MSVLTPDCFRIVDRPEILIGLVAPLGTPLPLVERSLEEDLTGRGYQVHKIRLSALIEGLLPDDETSDEERSEYERVRFLMDRGNVMREKGGGGQALALLAASQVFKFRTEEDLPTLDGHAFIFRQLKHPEEALWLRLIYGPSFHLVGVYSPEDRRKEDLREAGMTAEEAAELLDRDKSEGQDLGQRLRDTFHQADVFIPAGGLPSDTECEVKRYLRLVFGDLREGVETPTRDEYGMFLAATAALRSADLSRQVGAAVLRETGEVIGLGANEVPSGGGGQYWGQDSADARDYVRGHDANTRRKKRIVEEILGSLDEELPKLPEDQREIFGEVLRRSSLMDLTEFGRAVHAEMEALLSAARSGSSVQGCRLFTTTFPCHNCAKHLVGAGLTRVVYIEPYPKSKTMDMHSDSIRLAETERNPNIACNESNEDEKMVLEPFVGVAPRRYWSLFSMVGDAGEKYARKDDDGNVLKVVHGLRSEYSTLNYMEREAAALAALKDFVSSKGEAQND